jgi:hypothetical protein
MPDPLPPPIGQLNLFSSVRPPLPAGHYQVELRQEIDRGGEIAPVTRHLEVSAPQVQLTATDVHSVFPPPNSEGAFENRLAQVALRRRTLPWERGPAGVPVGQRPPWLALVLLASGEANFISGCAVADAFTPEARAGLSLPDGTCDAVEVSSKVVLQVFPRIDELDLLCHVRQVNLADTEYAGSDDDGFVAIVLSNRLPQAGQRYGAYLISLEGQHGELPTPPNPVPLAARAVDEVTRARVYEEDDATLALYSYASTRRAIDFEDTEQPRLADGGATTASPWNQAPEAATAEPIAVAVNDVPFLEHAIDFPALHAATREAPPRLLRFPVLARWSFACTGDGDFQTLAQRLDVGLLGSAPAPANTPPKATTLRSGDTGHTIVEYRTRRGQPSEAWYRGPFTPRQVVRRAAARPYHVADQALRVAEDGLVDISEAAAFELGRLLALSSGELAELLLRWRRDGILRRRLASESQTAAALRLSAAGTSPVDSPPSPAVQPVVAQTAGRTPRTPSVATPQAAPTGRLARGLSVDLLAQLGRDGALGPPVPPTDPGVLGLLEGADPAELARGLHLSRTLIDEVLSPRVTERELDRDAFRRRVDLEFDTIAAHKRRLDALVTGLDRAVARTIADANRVPEPPEPTQTAS